ncbi:MAG: phosphoglycerate dehydrogenase [Pseudomonadota bacterium]
MPKVLISDKMAVGAADIFKERGVEVDVKTGLTPDELIKIIPEYDGLAVRSSTKVTQNILDAAKNLKVIGRAGIGVDTIDVPHATQRGVVVMNTPFGNATTTAEHAIAMMMSLARMIPQANSSTHAGKWEKSKFLGTEITGKTLSIVGCGNIGTIVASRANGLSMKVVAYDPFLTEERAKAIGVEKVDLDEALRRADFITLHTPLTEKTRNIISGDKIKLLKKGAFLINCARGGLVDETALKDALDEGHLAGAALDVFYTEPAKEHPLFGHEKLICTPHLGASTREAQDIVAIQIAEQMSDFLLTGAVSNAINMPSVTAAEAPILKPYIELAEYLGKFIGQLPSAGLKSIEIIYDGNIAKLNTKPISAAAISGILKPIFGSVNLVNGPVVLKNQGIALSESVRDRTGIYEGYIMLKLEAENSSYVIAGTVFSDQKPRITRINDVRLEAEFSKYMLFTENQDRPGYIGALGTLLGNENINIANFRLGRTSEGSEALALVEIDTAPDDKTIQDIIALPQVLNAVSIALN